MILSDREKEILEGESGESGEAARIAIGQQISVGEFFGAEHFVPVTNSQIMGDTEVMDMYREMEMTFWLEKAEEALAEAG